MRVVFDQAIPHFYLDMDQTDDVSLSFYVHPALEGQAAHICQAFDMVVWLSHVLPKTSKKTMLKKGIAATHVKLNVIQENSYSLLEKESA